MSDEQHLPTDEEREALLREELKRLRVVDVAGEVMVTLVTLGYQKMGLTSETLDLRNLTDARLAIELLRGLIETLEREKAGDVQAFRSTLAAMQLQYARVATLQEGVLPGGGEERSQVDAERAEERPERSGEEERPEAAREERQTEAAGQDEEMSASGTKPKPGDGASGPAKKLWVPPGVKGEDKPL